MAMRFKEFVLAEEKRDGVYIKDPDAFEKLTQLEGERWAKKDVRGGEYTFTGLLQQWLKAEAEIKEFNNGQALTNYEEASPKDLISSSYCVVYGEGGYARYTIQLDGELRLNASSTLKEKVALAQSLGFRLC